VQQAIRGPKGAGAADGVNVVGVLGVIGDLLEDVVVHLHEEVNVASDTEATVIRRRGGSAANVVEAAIRAGGRARFIGQVGDDGAGHWLTDQLAAIGADVVVRRAGRTGTIVVLLDVHGERTMLADRASATELRDPDPAWLDGLHTLHIPFYSLAVEPLGATTRTLAAWAHERGIRVSVDVSSAAVLAPQAGRAMDDIRGIGADVILANELEAQVLGERLHVPYRDGVLVVVKHGAAPAVVSRPDFGSVEVPAITVPGVTDTTGAGDAFAAGMLLGLAAGLDPVAAVHRHGGRATGQGCICTESVIVGSWVMSLAKQSSRPMSSATHQASAPCAVPNDSGATLTHRSVVW
jgi:sugar/nucleoside kinase (ribokinase family)